MEKKKKSKIFVFVPPLFVIPTHLSYLCFSTVSQSQALCLGLSPFAKGWKFLVINGRE